MGARKRWKRTDLFLVRVWRDFGNEVDGQAAGTADDEEVEEHHGAAQAWHGQVRRVSSGESLQFDSLGGLLDVLTAMLGGTGYRGKE